MQLEKDLTPVDFKLLHNVSANDEQNFPKKILLSINNKNTLILIDEEEKKFYEYQKEKNELIKLYSEKEPDTFKSYLGLTNEQDDLFSIFFRRKNELIKQNRQIDNSTINNLVINIKNKALIKFFKCEKEDKIVITDLIENFQIFDSKNLQQIFHMDLKGDFENYLLINFDLEKENIFFLYLKEKSLYVKVMKNIQNDDESEETDVCINKDIFSKKLPTSFRVLNSIIFYNIEDQIFCYDLTLSKSTDFKKIEDNFVNFFQFRNDLFILYEKNFLRIGDLKNEFKNDYLKFINTLDFELSQFIHMFHIEDTIFLLTLEHLLSYRNNEIKIVMHFKDSIETVYNLN